MNNFKDKMTSYKTVVFLLLLIPTSFSQASEINYPWSEEVFLQLERDYGELPTKRFRAIYDLVLTNRDKPTYEKLQAVNVFVNLFEVKEDNPTLDDGDYWSAPYELLISFSGDSEDFAIAKLAILELMGIPKHELFLGYAKQKAKGGSPIMVLVWLNESHSQSWVLDHIEKRILSGNERQDLLAYYLTDVDGNLILPTEEKGNRTIRAELPNRTIQKLENVKQRVRLIRKKYEPFNGGNPLFLNSVSDQ